MSALSNSPEVLKIALALGGIVAAAWHIAISAKAPPANHAGKLPDSKIAGGTAAASPAPRPRFGLRILLFILCLAAVPNYYAFKFSNLTTDVHLYDAYFYYVGSKYFDELGYERLVPATIIADAEGANRFRAFDRKMFREQPSQRVVPFDRAMNLRSEIISRFAPERWAAFKADIDWFTASLPERSWDTILTDYGYNATPFGRLTQQFISNLLHPGQLKWAGYFDLVLLCAALIVIGRVFGMEASLFAALFMFVSYSGRWPPIGASMLRLDWLAAMLVAACCLRRNRRAAAGLSFGYAICARGFPAFFAFGLVVRSAADLVRGRWRNSPSVSFLAWTTGACLLLSGLTVAVQGWGSFSSSFEKLRRYQGVASLMPGHIGVDVAMAAQSGDQSGAARRERILSLGAPTFVVGTIAILSLIPAMIRRDREEEAFAFGEVAFFVGTIALYYYHLTRAVLVTTQSGRPARWSNALGLILLFAVEAVSNGFRAANWTRQAIGEGVSIALGVSLALICIARLIEMIPSLDAKLSRALHWIASSADGIQRRDRIATAALLVAGAALLVAIYARNSGQAVSAITGAPGTQSLEFSEWVPGVAGGAGRIQEARTSFGPNERVAIQGVLSGRHPDAILEFEWIDPSGTCAYRKSMKIRASWTHVWTTYRGPTPMSAGRWAVRISRGETALCSTGFDVHRSAGEMPIRKALAAFEANRLSLVEAHDVLQWIQSAIGQSPDSEDQDRAFPGKIADRRAHVAIRLFSDGRLLHAALGTDDNLENSARSALPNNIHDLRDGRTSTAELTVIHAGEMIPCTPGNVSLRLKGNVGFSIQCGGHAALLTPMELVTRNLNSGEDILRQLCTDAGVGEESWRRSDCTLVSFRAQQFALNAGSSETVEYLCGRSIRKSPLTLNDLRSSVELGAAWLAANQSTDGRYLYSYDAASDKIPDDDWCLRGLNAAYVMAEIGHDGAPGNAFASSADRAMTLYAAHLDRLGDGLFVKWNEPRIDSGLGSTAFLLAALATRNREGDAECMAKLANAIMQEQQPSGRFSTDFVHATDREIDQLFYPGEAMLALMLYHERTNDPRAMETVARAFAYYREYKRGRSEAPYVPWQIRCFSALYRYTRHDVHRDYCFELADWMLDKYPLIEDLGAPEECGALSSNLASTGVYAEGLAAAYRLAVESQDLRRTERYGFALAGCARYLTGLQFKQQDVYPYASPKRMLGALATKPRDNALRLDFTYHAISALRMITQFMDEAQWRAYSEKSELPRGRGAADHGG